MERLDVPFLFLVSFPLLSDTFQNLNMANFSFDILRLVFI